MQPEVTKSLALRLTNKETLLDPKKLPEKVVKLQGKLNHKVIGQDRAIKEIVKAYTTMTVNIQREGRPLGVFLFLGPTGVGKTEVVRQFAAALLGDRNRYTRIDCTEYAESHAALKLTGAPPSYLGYGDEPRLSQKNINKYQTKTEKTNILLFDEIEKGAPKLWDTIMTILGDGILTLGTGAVTNFERTFIFLTSNLGSEDTRKILDGSGLGFQTPRVTREETDDKLYRAAKAQVKKHFRPEFANRLDRIVVFRPLSRESLKKILKLELDELQWRIWRSPWHGLDFASGERIASSRSIIFKLTDAASEFLLDEGTSEVFGARELNRVIDRFVGFPMASLIASEQLVHGDTVKVDKLSEEEDFRFLKQEKI